LVLGEEDASVDVVDLKHGDLLLPFWVVAVSEVFTSVHGGTLMSAELEAEAHAKPPNTRDAVGNRGSSFQSAFHLSITLLVRYRSLAGI